MATDSSLLTQINTAIEAVVAGLAAGKFITEYREGGVQIKKANPQELLAELRKCKQELEGATAERYAGVSTFRGAG